MEEINKMEQSLLLKKLIELFYVPHKSSMAKSPPLNFFFHFGWFGHPQICLERVVEITLEAM